MNELIKETRYNSLVKLFFQMALFLVLTVFVLIIVRDNYLACLERFPREYRDSANVSIARAFYDGINPYVVPDDGAICAYVYGFVNPLIAAAISRISGLDILNSLYILYFVFTFAFCILLTCEVGNIVKNHCLIVKTENKQRIKTWKKNIEDEGLIVCEDKLWMAIFLLLIFIISSTLTYRWGHITTIPDTMGMAIGIAILMISRRCKTWKSVLAVSVLVVLEFYVKAYFLFFAGPVFIFFLIKNRRALLQFIVFCLLIGIVSIVAVDRIFPLYFIENIYFEFIEQFFGVYAETGADTSLYETHYMISQFVKLIAKYNFVLFVGVSTTVYALTDGMNHILSYRRREKSINNRENISKEDNITGSSEKKDFEIVINELMIYISDICIAFPLLLVLGRNDGAYMSYHFQLLMPAVIVIAFTCLMYVFFNADEFKCVRVGTHVVQAVIICGVLVSTYKAYVAFGKVKLLTEEQKKNWEYVEAICLEAYDEGKLIYPGNLVNGMMADRRSFYSDKNGHIYLAEAKNENLYSAIENETLNVVFDDLSEMFTYAIQYNRETSKKFSESKYDIIIADEGQVLELVDKDRYESEDLTLSMGIFDCGVTVFTKTY